MTIFKTIRKPILFAIGAMCWQLSTAQVINIIDGGVAACSGTLVDSGGEGGPGYGVGEDITLVLCPDAPGSAIRIDWSTFEVDNNDFMEVYNGTSTADPLLITLNVNTAGSPVVVPFGSATGCVTLRFVSDAASAGGSFVGNISCYVPCEPPIAVATMSQASPAMVCMGEPITFDASGSTSSGGNSIAEYRWNFVDGTVDSLSGAVVTHAYEAPGAYTVRLLLTDNSTEQCESTNAIDLQVLVGTPPDFSALVLDPVTICLGESVPLSAIGVEPVQWSGAPIIDLGSGVYLPDELNTPFVSEVTFTGFQPGSSLQSVEQLSSICVSMEHSFMGDLDILIECPNGSQAFMVDYDGVGSGGGTFIGDALDTEEVPPVPGNCLDYCWTPNATNGTFSSSAAGGTTENVLPSVLDPGYQMLAPGDYQSEQPLSQLVGCPLNGTWSFIVIDNQGIDDGFICSWGITFAPELYPDLVSFEPVLGVSSPDSAIWTGPGVAIDPQNPLLATATPIAEGSFNYIFSITDDFGCTYDTSMVITVLPGIPSPLNILGDDEICEGTVTQLSGPAGYTSYEWSNGFQGQNISATPGTYTVTVFSGDCSLESEPFVVSQVPTPAPVITGPGFSCGGAPATLSTLEQYGSYNWSNGSQSPTITVGTGSYSVVATENGCSGTSAPFVVTVGSAPDASIVPSVSSPQGIGATVNFNGSGSQGNGSPLTVYDWYFGIPGQGASGANTSYTFMAPGSYGIVLTITAADGCQDSTVYNFTILPESIIIPNVFTPNGDANNEYFVIENGQYYTNTLSVYNRWGKEVYGTKNYRNTWRAADVPDGTYYYVFRTEDDGKEYTGHVTILR
ncbi:MAG: gliding motility-associated C-terminal domain-containing protein [Flavobacteriales bacterium]|nr:gliding motility-associated C-terminal domain-containing protein [Flavobacteriales bacterium]